MSGGVSGGEEASGRGVYGDRSGRVMAWLANVDGAGELLPPRRRWVDLLFGVGVWVVWVVWAAVLQFRQSPSWLPPGWLALAAAVVVGLELSAMSFRFRLAQRMWVLMLVLGSAVNGGLAPSRDNTESWQSIADVAVLASAGQCMLLVLLVLYPWRSSWRNRGLRVVVSAVAVVPYVASVQWAGALWGPYPQRADGWSVVGGVAFLVLAVVLVVVSVGPVVFPAWQEHEENGYAPIREAKNRKHTRDGTGTASTPPPATDPST